MVRRFLDTLASPIRGLHQAAYWLMLLTLVSQVLALLRDRTFAHAFGAGQVLDLYYAAFRVPDLVFALIASLVSAYVLIPRMMGVEAPTARRLISESISFLVILGGVICLALAIFAPRLLALIYPEFTNAPEWGAFVLLARILLLQPIILGVSGVVTSVSQVHRLFVLYALSPVLYNLGIIFGTVVLYPLYGLPGIGIGVVIGALANVIIHLPILRDLGVAPQLVWPRLREMLPVMRDSIPRSLALGMGSLTALVLTAFAAKIGSGAISTFTLAGNLEAVPLALIGGTYAVAAFPSLSETAGKDQERFTSVLSSSARHIIVWSIVLMGLIVVLRAYIVRVILGSGAFDWNATRLTAALLAIFAIGLVAQGLVLLLSRALYAAKQSWRPLLYQIGGFAVTAVSALLLLGYADRAPGFLASLSALFRIANIPGTGVLLLALASTLGQVLLAIAALIALRRAAPGLATSLMRPLAQGLFATVVGGLASYGVLAYGGNIIDLTTTLAVFTRGVLAGIVGLASALLVLYLLGSEEFGEIFAALHGRARRFFTLPPSAEEPVQP